MSAQPEERVVRSADGTEIGLTKLGSGPSLVLVHGGVSAGGAWLPVASAMAEQFTCYVMDRRGRGRSRDGAEYSLDRECEDINAAMDLAGPGSHLLGHSYGGICALEAACRVAPDRLVLYEPPLLFGRQKLEKLIEGVRTAIESNDLDNALTIFLGGGPELSEDEVSALRATPLWKDMVALTPTLTRELEAMTRLGTSLDRYRDLSVPTLLLLGTATSADLNTASRALEEALPDVRTVLLEGQGHAANLTAPDMVAREVADFLLSRH